VDLEREVSSSEALEVANEKDVPYIETSAKTGAHVSMAFEELVKEIWAKASPPLKEKKTKSKKQQCISM